MSERNLDFDNIIERIGTKSLKYDFAKRRGMPEDILPLWVADMDFRVSSFIEDAIKASADHGIYGYTETEETYFEAVKDWMMRQYDFDVPEEKMIIKTPGIVMAIAVAVNAFTEKGDAVLINSPVYYPFSEVIQDNKREIVSSDLVEDGKGSYRIDLDDFEKKIVENHVKLYLLCNPHNPGSKSWSFDELKGIGEICLRHGVTVLSDEIHADFEWERRHIVFAGISPELSDITITCTSPTKTFNIAGLQLSNIIIKNRSLRYRFKKQLDAFGYSQANAIGIFACEAAYRFGDTWLNAVRKYIKQNIDHTIHFLSEHLEAVKVFAPQATYLLWMDFRGTGLSDGEIDQKMIREAGLWLDSGKIFGDSGKGFQRINVACPRCVLDGALSSISNVF